MRLRATHLFLVCLTLLIAFGQLLMPGSAHGQDKEQLLNATADSLVNGEINGLPVEQLVGHVRFWQGPLYGSADRAVQYLQANRIDLEGNVEIHQDTLALFAPTVTYNGNTRIGSASGGVRLTDRDVVLTANRGEYDMNYQAATFHDHVMITQGRTVSRSDNLTYYRGTQTTILTGGVHVVSDSGSLRANRVTYVRALDETTAEGSVQLANDSLRLLADWFYNAKPAGVIYARGHVNVEDRKNHTVIYGDTLARFEKLGYSVVPRNPLLLSIDTSSERDTLTGKLVTRFDTMFLRARVMEAYQGDSTRFIATDSVRVLRQSFSAVGGKVYYDEQRNVMILSGAARQRLWYDSTEVDADSIALILRERHVTRVHAVGHAFTTNPVAEFPNSDRVDQLQGDRMLLIVERDTVRRLFDMGSALSMYFLVRDKKADGVNRASGDTIRIDFQDRAVTRLAVLSGTEGEYFPERFIGRRASAFRLSNYERHPELRPHRAQFFVPWSLPPLVPPAPTPETTPTPKKKRNS